MSNYKSINCPSCGAPLPADQKLITCTYCGRELKVNTAKLDSAAIPTGSDIPTRTHMSGKKLLMILASLVLLVIVGIVGYHASERARYNRTINSAVLSPDGKYLATVHGVSFSAKPSLRIWDANNGNQLRLITDHNNIIWSVSWSPDGKMIATGYHDGDVRLWNAADGKLLRTLSGNRGLTKRIAWSPDSQLIAVGDENGVLKIWRTDEDKLVEKLALHKDRIEDVSFSPDGRMIATVSWDNTGKVVDLLTGLTLQLSGHTSYVTSLCWSPDSKRIATSALDSIGIIFDITTGQPLVKLTGHKNSIDQIAFAPNGKLIATASVDDTVRIWNSSNGENINILDCRNSFGERNLRWSPDSKLIASGNNSAATVWEVDSSKVIYSLPLTDSNIHIIGLTAQNKLYATSGYDGLFAAANISEKKTLFNKKLSFLSALMNN